jgi:hypothetical protein
MRRPIVLLTAFTAGTLLAAGLAEAASPAKVATLGDQRLRDFQKVATDRGIRLGSVGSGMFRTRSDKPHEFYMVTDRGPNGEPDGKRTFPVPDFDPTIVKIRVKGKKVEILKRIPLKTRKGEPVTGLPNFDFVDSPVSGTEPASDEVPYNFDGSKRLETYNQNGLDTEDIVRTSKGDFWIVDEYRPSVVKVSGEGTVLARYVPKGLKDEFTDVGYPVHDTLPASHAYRRQNRGYEGLALSPDQKHLFVALQSPLQLPPDTTVGRDSRNTRILRLDLSGHVTGEFVYRFDWAADFDPDSRARARDMKISGLYALSDRKVLVLERTDFVAKVYLVDVSDATDLGDWKPPSGADRNYVETLNSAGELQAAGITPLPKQLVLDLDSVDGMPDKIESIAVVDRTTLAVANDNDFGLTDDPTWDRKGRLTNDSGAKSRILYVTLPKSLPKG